MPLEIPTNNSCYRTMNRQELEHLIEKSKSIFIKFN